MTLTTSVLHDDGIALIALAGELDMSVVRQLDEVVTSVLDDGLRRVLLDLDALRFCDSTGLGAIVRASHRVRDAGGTLVVAGARASVQRVLEQPSARTSLRLAPAVQPALVALQQSSDA